MKLFPSLLTAGVLAFVSFATLAQAASLTITEAMSSSGVTDDWFELTNISTQAISLSGYRVDDSSFSFSVSVALNNVTTLAPGQSAVFIESAAGANVEAFRAYWGLSSTALIGYYSGSGVGLAATGDGLVVFDSAGAEVTPRATFGTATTGASFYFDRTSGTYAGISTVGQAGVFTSTAVYGGAAAATNIGSPEFGGVVPEPSAWVILGLGAGALGVVTLRRRKRAA